jgi:hypothetical protein
VHLLFLHYHFVLCVAARGMNDSTICPNCQEVTGFKYKKIIIDDEILNTQELKRCTRYYILMPTCLHVMCQFCCDECTDAATLETKCTQCERVQTEQCYYFMSETKFNDRFTKTRDENLAILQSAIDGIDDTNNQLIDACTLAKQTLDEKVNELFEYNNLLKRKFEEYKKQKEYDAFALPFLANTHKRVKLDDDVVKYQNASLTDLFRDFAYEKASAFSINVNKVFDAININRPIKTEKFVTKSLHFEWTTVALDNVLLYTYLLIYS